MASDNGPLEHYDRVTFNKFASMVDTEKMGEEIGIGRMGMWGVFDAEIEKTGILSQGTGKVWYESLVGGLRELDGEELPSGAVFGVEFGSTFRINTQVYLGW
jgi:D-amino-acid oxidase